MNDEPKQDVAVLDRLVQGVYRALLLRDADPDGAAHFRAEILAGLPIEDFIRVLLSSEEFQQVLPELLWRFLPEGRRRLIFDQAQHGEIALLVARMVNAGAVHRVVVDIGAHGRQRSNAYDLMLHFGWRGLLVEPNPALHADLERDFAGLDYRLAACAVSDHAGTADLHIGVNDDVSSLDEAATAAWGPTRSTARVRVLPLVALLEEYAIPRDFDVLSVDAEGADVSILNNLAESRWRPGWIIAELGAVHRAGHLEESGLDPRFFEAYRMIDETWPNLIFQRR